MSVRDPLGHGDPYSTLPSEALPDLADQTNLCLAAVIAFHPQASRIGERWLNSPDTSELTIGRDAPVFSGRQSRPAGLLDQHISREALTVNVRDGNWVVRRRPGSSRLRVNGRELVEEVVLSSAELQGGVVLTLGNRVVLHLRLESPATPADIPSALETALPGVGTAANALRQAVLSAAQSAGDVLLIGPTGSGKERVARAVHDFGNAPAEPWVAVNMAALPGDIATASLFGVRKGAYTGADQHRTGYFQQAQGGTLFLDEIADASEVVQPLLLRALQEREVQVVGGSVTRVSLRVIAAMEWDPDEEATGLRPALRYRLGAHEIRLPALSERMEDVGLLATAFLGELQEKSDGAPWSVGQEVPLDDTDTHTGTVAAESEALAAGAVMVRWALCFESLLLHDWPGNIRELKQVIGQMTAAGLQRPTLPERLRREAKIEPAEQSEAFTPHDTRTLGVAEDTVAPASLADIDEPAFLDAWNDAGFSPTRLARSLGVSRSAVYRRVERTPACRLAGDVPLGELLAMLDQCRGDLEQTAEQLSVSSRGLATRLRASGIRSSTEQSSDHPPVTD